MNTTQTKDRGGRPPGSESIRSTAARKASIAIDALAEIAGDAKAPAADRIKAACAILDAAQPANQREDLWVSLAKGLIVMRKTIDDEAMKDFFKGAF